SPPAGRPNGRRPGPDGLDYGRPKPGRSGGSAPRSPSCAAGAGSLPPGPPQSGSPVRSSLRAPDDEERGGLRNQVALDVRRREIEVDELHRGTGADIGDPAGGPKLVARPHRTMKGEALLSVDQMGGVERHLRVGPELPVGVEAVDHGVRRGRHEVRLLTLVPGCPHVGANRFLGHLEGTGLIGPPAEAAIGHCSRPCSRMARPMSPLTFSFCCMKAGTGFSLPVAMLIQSSVEATNVVLGASAGPGLALAAPSWMRRVQLSPVRSNW